MTERKLSEHFYAREFVCHCGKCPGSDPNKVPMEPKLIHELELLQRLLDRPILIVSGFRCANRNKAVGGCTNSEHTKGNAVDISCSTIDGYMAYQKLIALCWNNASFQGVVVHDKYIHVDIGHVRENSRVNCSHFQITKTGVTQTDIFTQDYDYRKGS